MSTFSEDRADPFGHTALCVERNVESMRRHVKPEMCPICSAFRAGAEQSEMQWTAFTQRLDAIARADGGSILAAQILQLLEEFA